MFSGRSRPHLGLEDRYTLWGERVFIAVGKLLSSLVRHDAAVLHFHVPTVNPNRLHCARSDAHITTWDTADAAIRIDNVDPDPDWTKEHAQARRETIVGWADMEKHHTGLHIFRFHVTTLTGPVCYVQVSPNGRYMASASHDHTCKLWDILSYRKSLQVVAQERKVPLGSLQTYTALGGGNDFRRPSQFGGD